MNHDWIKIEVCHQENQRVAATIEIEAMKAENDQAKFKGRIPPYGESYFRKVMEAHGFHQEGLEEKKEKLT